MGVVHLALDPASRAVAIKVLRPHLAADPEARARLAREGDTLRLVRSPRVAEVLETAAEADPPYIVTQFVAAPPLDEHVAAHGPLRGRPLARLGLGLGEALAAIHRAGVVHRDLKPGNVLVDDDGPVVIDFGIAQIADDIRLTSAGLVMGTPGYLSPEVIDGAPVSFAGDWWGWAATMLFAATGRPPFGTGPLDAVLARVHRGAPDVSGVEEPFGALLRAAMSSDPADRPTPRRLREALQAVAGGDDADAPAAALPVPARAEETTALVVPEPDDDEHGFDGTAFDGAGFDGTAFDDDEPDDDEPGPDDEDERDGAVRDAGLDASHHTVVLGCGAAAAKAPEPDGFTRPLPVHAGCHEGPGSETTVLDQRSAAGSSGAPTAAAPPLPHDRARADEQTQRHQPYQVGEEEYAPRQGLLAPAPAPQVPVYAPPPAPYAPDPYASAQYAPDAYQPGSYPPVLHPGGSSGSEVDPSPTQPPLVRGRAWIALLLAAAVSVAGGIAPVRVTVGLVAASVLLRTIDRSADGLRRRRWERGARGSDAPLAVLALPLHLLAAALITLGALVLPALMGVSAAFITGWALNPGTPLPGSGLALAVGCAVAVTTAWWGLGGASLRRGTRLLVRAATPSQPAVAIGAGVLTLVLLAVVVVVGGENQPTWAPLQGPPLGIGQPLG